MAGEESSSSSSWSWDQNIAFEDALAVNSEDCSDFWERVTAAIPEKTIDEVKHHYILLVEDINNIESGLISLPNYISSSDGLSEDGCSSQKSGNSRGNSKHGGKGSKSEQERRKGIAWSEEEHRLFLQGLKKYGKGDWRSISRKFVISRTPTQVASHAQKYFIRLNSMSNKDRRRSSIHDITSTGNGESELQGPIIGQANGPTVPSGKPSKQPPPPPPPGAPHGVRIYGSTIGQPVNGPLVSVVGTPVDLPAYGLHASASGSAVHGALANLTPMGFPMPHKFNHR